MSDILRVSKQEQHEAQQIDALKERGIEFISLLGFTH
jgi:DNA invertase Pin-like site-specific DNA recombinase